MTPRAVAPELAAMFIAMAARTLSRKSQVRTVQIRHEDATAGCNRYVLRLVALFTGYAGVAAAQREACLVVVEGFATWLPMNELEVDAVVVGVAAYAVLSCRVYAQKGGV